MQPQTKQSDISRTGRINYHRRYPIYPVNQVPTINNNLKVHSEFYWWDFYLTFIKQIITQRVAYTPPPFLTGRPTNVKSKAGYWYEVAGENPQWSSTNFTTVL